MATQDRSVSIMFCREGYQDADAALAHLQNVGPLLAEFQKLTDLLRLEFPGAGSRTGKASRSCSRF